MTEGVQCDALRSARPCGTAIVNDVADRCPVSAPDQRTRWKSARSRGGI